MTAPCFFRVGQIRVFELDNFLPALIPPHYILVKYLRKYEVEDIDFNFLQIHGIRKIS